MNDKESNVLSVIRPMSLLDIMIEEFKFVYGDHRHDTYSHSLLDQVWWTLFNLDRQDIIASPKEFDTEVQITLKDGSKETMTVDQVDDLIEQQVYNLQNDIDKSNSAFGGSMILIKNSNC